jgi:hypothetical protein
LIFEASLWQYCKGGHFFETHFYIVFFISKNCLFRVRSLRQIFLRKNIFVLQNLGAPMAFI